MTAFSREALESWSQADAGPSVERALGALISVSRAVAESVALEQVLATIVRVTTELLGGTAAAIIQPAAATPNGLAVVEQYGLSEEYASDLNRIRPIELGHGPSGMAAMTGEPVTVEDVMTSELFRPWRGLAVREYYRSTASAPLRLADDIVGVLTVYRAEVGAWEPYEVSLLQSLADQAAIAMRTSELLDESRDQVRALSLVVQSLRAQGHEHSNLLHAVSGLLAMGEPEEARRLIAASEDVYHSVYARVTSRIDIAAIAGFLLAEAVAAGNSSIDLRIDRRSRLRALPPRLSELDAITILGNLVRNAIEAVSEMTGARRRVTVYVYDRSDEVVFRVRDWGPGIDADQTARLFQPGYSTKPEHAGVGLAIVRSAVNRARGRIEVDHPNGAGLVVTVSLPT